MGQFRLAEVDFTSVLGDSTYPHHWEAYYNLGLANLGTRNLAAAEDSFRRAIAAPLPVFEAYLRLAEVRQQQGNPKSAEQLLDEAMLRFPDRAEAPLALGRLLVALGRVNEARPFLERIIQSYPDSPAAAEARHLLAG
jgi:TolA-binding protein